MIRMSQTHPLEIAVVSGETFSGALGVTLAPGKWDPGSASGGWARDLATDLDAIAAWRARVVVTLIEPHEFDLLRIRSLGGEVRRRGMDWLHLPIRDVSVPDAAFEAAWPEHSAALRKRLAAGENVLVHCRGDRAAISSFTSRGRVFSCDFRGLWAMAFVSVQGRPSFPETGRGPSEGPVTPPDTSKPSARRPSEGANMSGEATNPPWFNSAHPDPRPA